MGRDRRKLLVANGAGLEGQGIVTFVVMSLLARCSQQDQLFWKRKIRSPLMFGEVRWAQAGQQYRTLF